MQTDNGFEEILEPLRKGVLPEGTDPEELTVLITGQCRGTDQRKAERALLTLYYLWKGSPGFEGAEPEELRRSLETLCGDAGAEANEFLRGRKLWVLLKLAFADGRLEDVRNLIEELGAREKSEWVWQRIFNLIGSEDEGYRFYPDPLARLPVLADTELECWNAFVREQEGYIRYALTLAGHLKTGMRRWIEEYAAGKMDSYALTSQVRACATAGQPFPLPASELAALYHAAGRTGRLRIFELIRTYLSDAVEPRKAAQRMRFVFDTAPETDADIGFFERSVSLTLGLMAAAPDDPSASSAAFGAAMDLLAGGIPEGLRSPELLHDICSSLSPHLLRILGERNAPAADVLRAAALLSDESAYLQQLGATILLQAVRSGYDIAPAAPAIREALARDSATSNGLAAGKEIEDEDSVFSPSLPSLKAFGLSIEEEEGTEEEDGFMNLRSLTGLLEMCQPPTTALRLKLALEILPEAGVFEETLTGTTGTPAAAAPRVTGPMALGEILALFKDAGGAMERLSKLTVEKETELSGRYREILSGRRRGMIKSVFEGSFAETPGLYAETRERIDADGRRWPGPFDPPGIEGSFDYLAWYLPALPLPEGKRAYSGVYFRASRILRFAEKNRLPMEDLLRLIAVHELFHAFCEQRTGRLHSHEGESPEYCRLEEAGANGAAFEWGTSALGEARLKPFLSSLLSDRESNPAALPGYGEYRLLDAEAPGWLPLILGEGEEHIQPPEYAHRRLLLSGGHQREFETSRLVWKGMADAIEEEQVCWFLDLR